MLKQHGIQIHRAAMTADVLLTAAVFFALILHPPLRRPDVVSEIGAMTVAGLAIVVGLGWPLLLGRFGVYRSRRRESIGALVARLAYANGVGALLLSAVCFMLEAPLVQVFPLVMASVLFGVQSMTRVPAVVLLRAIRRSGRNYRNVLIVGAGPRAAEASETIEGHPEWGLRIHGFLDDGGSNFHPAVPLDKVCKFIDLPQILRESEIDEVLVACPRAMLGELTPVVRECAMIGVPVTLLTDLFGDELPPPRAGSFDALGTLSFAPVHHNDMELGLKRGLDVVAAGLALAFAAPLIGVAALAIRATSRGPVFFTQVRCGLNGRRFEMLKLRTMVQNAEARKAELLHLNEMDGPVFKITDDPRVTPIGRLLRKWSIDELPQLWNVLRGEMSLVGPRPPTPDEVIQYQGSERRRLSMRPGITCLWQVSGRNEINFDEWMALDLEYIDEWSLAADCKILLRTIPEVLRARGAS